MNKFSLKALLAAAALLAAGSAAAELPYGTLTFVERVGAATPHEQIDIWMHLTLDAASPALDFSSNPLAGIDPADLPTEGWYTDPITGDSEIRAVAEVRAAFLNTYFGCDDTFTGGCNSDTTNYSYSFFLSSQPGKPSINFRESFSLLPGASYDYVFGQFDPAAAGAQLGTYKFYRTAVTLNFQAYDVGGNYLSTGYHEIARTCAGGNNDDCAFTRVVAVPEPATTALMLLGLAAVGVSVRRRRS